MQGNKKYNKSVYEVDESSSDNTKKVNPQFSGPIKRTRTFQNFLQNNPPINSNNWQNEKKNESIPSDKWIKQLLSIFQQNKPIFSLELDTDKASYKTAHFNNNILSNNDSSIYTSSDFFKLSPKIFEKCKNDNNFSNDANSLNNNQHNSLCSSEKSWKLASTSNKTQQR